MSTGPDSEGPSGPLAALLADAVYAESLDCVHCGLCLTSCPTYRVSGRETSSPRGRVYLMRGLAEGRLTDTEVLEEEAFLCLGCRACETACPSGVRYGEMLEHTRAILRPEATRAGRFDLAIWLERFALRRIVPHRSVLAALVGLLGLVQRIGLDRAVARVLPERLRQMQSLLPRIPPSDERSRMPAFTPASGPRRGRVALFEGCVMPEFFGRVNEAARLVLSRAGYEVVVPQAQGCCGALQAHSGDLETAVTLAKENASVFGLQASELDAIIVTSAGCSAAMRESHHDHWLGESGRCVSDNVRDVLEFLDEVGLGIDCDPVPKRVCYDDPCHLVHAQSIGTAPRRLLAGIPELELVAHRNPEACCGAAGIYNLTQPKMSQQVLSPKLDSLLEADPEIVATANPGCAMQLAAGLSARGRAISVLHPIELLEQATRSA